MEHSDPSERVRRVGKDRNLAILAKLCWRLASEQESPWAAILAAKYLTPRRMTEEGRKLPCSSVWSACKK